MSRRKFSADKMSYDWAMGGLALIALIVLLSPSLIVLVISFTDGMSLRFPPPGYSLRWYEALLDAWQLQYAAKNSLWVAIWSTILSIVFGVLGALAVARSPRLTARILDSVFMSPLVLPALSLGLASLLFFSLVGMNASMTTLIIGHAVVCVPYVVRNTVASLIQLEPALLECSASLGASRLYTLRRITLPLIKPGILAGGFIAFMSSFDNIPMSLFLRDAATDMLPIRMWQDLENRLDVTIAALSGVLILFTITAMVLMEKFIGLSRRMAS